MRRPTQAHTHLAALRQNYCVAKKCVTVRKHSANTWAVVKADAYGHGPIRCAKAFSDTADGFVLVDTDGAMALREAGLRHPILLLEGFFESEDLAVCAAYGLTTSVHCIKQLQIIRTARLSRHLPIYLKLNSGMNRLGFTLDQIPALRLELSDSSTFHPVTLMTRFAEAAGERGISWQLERFEIMQKKRQGVAPFTVSVANSAAILRYPGTANDWVRPGIMLYGGSPFASDDATTLSQPEASNDAA